MESDEEEPSPEALMRYMAMRRHTIGVGDSEHEQPQDVRAKLAQHKPLLGMSHVKRGIFNREDEDQVFYPFSCIMLQPCHMKLTLTNASKGSKVYLNSSP